MTDDQEREEALTYIRAEGLWEVLESEVRIATWSAKRRFGQYVSNEDTEQVLWEWIMRAPKKIVRWHKDKDHEGFTHILGAVLYDEATYHGRKAKADQLGYRLGDEFYYTKAMLRKLLPSVYNKGEWTNPPKWAKSEAGSRGGKALNEGFGWVTTLADISRALTRLPKPDQRVLFERYALRREYDELADDGNVATSTAHARVEAALKRLVDVLGGPMWLTKAVDREPDEGHWPAGRKAMSNAAARRLTDAEAAFEKKA